MPKILIIKQFVFLLYVADFFEKRKHIHVEIRKGKKRYVAKFWLEPEIEMFKRGNLSGSEINEAKKLIENNFEIFCSQIKKFNKGEKNKTIIK